jgi:hypothetical protein
MTPKSLTTDLVLSVIRDNRGKTAKELYDILTKKGVNHPIAGLRRILRKLSKEKKLLRIGVHQIRYKLAPKQPK